VSYNLQNGNDTFSIDPITGEITVNPSAVIDYEQDQIHTVMVQAISSDGSTSALSVDITIVDENDNAPVITAAQSLSVSENATTGQSLRKHRWNFCDRPTNR